MHEGKYVKPGACIKCGMKLQKITSPENQNIKKTHKQSYASIFIIIGLIFFGSICLTSINGFSIYKLVSTFMIGFFLVFSSFKLIDLKGFAKAYATYDLLARHFYWYGLFYPFLELFFAISMIMNYKIHAILILEIIVMVFSGAGVLRQLAKHEKFQCACLGTFLNVPLTNLTLIEDFGMAALAALLLIVGRV